MTKRWGLPLSLAVCAATTMGCSEIKYRSPATVHDEVVDITEKQVLSGQRVKVDQKGRLLTLRVKKLCDLVEDKRMAKISTKKSEENVTLEAVLMGLSTAPLTTGAIVYADAADVHPNDKNGRLYNETGQDGAQAAGILSMVLGTGMLVGSMISLIRRAKPDVDESEFHEEGEILASGKPCTGGLRTARVQVQGLLDNGQQVLLGNTNQFGELTVDLGRVVGANHFATINPPLGMQVMVGQDAYGLVDLQPVAEHHMLHRSNAWAAAEAEHCDSERTSIACQGVHDFLAAFPKGPHSTQARALVANIGKPRAKAKQVAQ